MQSPYMSFEPSIPFDLPLLPPSISIRNEHFVNVLLKTRTELGELNGYSTSLPNPLLLLSPAVLRESVASSNIENINTTMEQVLQMQIFPEAERKQPDKEVLNYRNAIIWGFENLKKLPVSSRLMLGIHKRLVPDQAEDFRRTQNRISNSATGEVLYTPPEPQNVSKLLSNLEIFLNNEDDGFDPLLKCAMAHYQFEAIHPFTDGNGRTGRILMVLQLIQSNLLSLPILYISGYINKNRSEYYKLLKNVSAKEEWTPFIEFLLNGYFIQAQETKMALVKLMTLLSETKDIVKTKHRKIYTADLVEALFAYPIITPVGLGKQLDINYRTASRYLAELKKGKILQESYVGKYHLFINKRLLQILKG